MIVGPINSGAAVGGNGVATATGESSHPISGLVYAVQVKYNETPPAGTTVVTIKTKGTNAPSMTILTLTNAATDGMWLPRLVSHTAAGVAQTAYDAPFAIDDIVQAVIAGANAGDNVDVYLHMF
jgi:hypothetical protein